MEIIASLNEDNKLTFLKVFAKLAAADGHIDDEEKEFAAEAKNLTWVVGIH